MKKIRLGGAVLLALFAMLFVFFPALAEENLVANPGFEQINDRGAPENWSKDMYRSDDISDLLVSEDAYEGESSVYIINYDINDARYSQTIRVEPNTLYEIRGFIKAEGLDPDSAGAGLSIGDTFASSGYVHDTQGEWVEVVLVGRTGEDQLSLNLFARIGGYGSENAGSAWFDAISMRKIDEEPEGYPVQDFSTLPPSAPDYGESEDVDRGNQDALILFTGMLYLLIAALGCWLIGTGRVRIEWKRITPKAALILILTLASAIRLIISLVVRGYGVDMNCFESWSATLAEVGPGNFYQHIKDTNSFCDYPPGYLYVLWILGLIRSALSLPYDGPVTWMLLKLPSMALDIVAAYLIYRKVKRAYGETAGVSLAALYALCPTTILNSAAWGQIDAVLAILLILTLLFAAERKWMWALPIYAAAVLIKPQALMFGPLGLFALIVDIVLRVRNRERVRECFLGVGLAILALLALALPFVSGMRPESPWVLSMGSLYVSFPFLDSITWLVELYTRTLESYDYITVNAANLYVLFDMNWVSVDEALFTKVMAWGLFGLSYIYAFFLYFRAKDPKKLFLIGATLLTLVFAFGIKMHERYAFPALIMLLMAYAVDRDARILGAFLALSLGQFLNAGFVLQHEHLQDSMALLNGAMALLHIAAAALTAWAGYDLSGGGRTMGITKVYRNARKREAQQAPDHPAADRLFRPDDWRLHINRIDVLIMAVLTLAYSVVAFTNLGSTKAPETQWVSSAPQEQLTFDLGERRTFHLTYYGGICDSAFTVEFSDDNNTWTEPELAQYDQGQIFRWLWYRPMERTEDGRWNEKVAGYPMDTARYIRLTTERRGLTLHEVAFLDENGNPLPIVSVHSFNGIAELADDPKALLDEQGTVPPYPSYYNGTYFDEIYHARTAYEHLHGLHAYEWTHPPLGKLIMSLGIRMFGMTPFGWRFMGALFGAAMVPLMFLFAKQLFKRTDLAGIAAFLLAADCMHYTQTRIATIDTYGVFFIILMYWLMLRYTQMNFNLQRLGKTFIPLGLCGIAMGLGIASKWICIYAGLGLAVILLITLLRRYGEYDFILRNQKQFDGEQNRVAQRAVKRYRRNVISTIAFCFVFFIAIPLLIYYVSYIPHLMPDDNFSVSSVIQVQKDIFGYHAGLGSDDHGFRSPWYEWPLIVKPMWYFDGKAYLPSNMVSSISCMGNPVVWWGGLIALIWTAYRWLATRGRNRSMLFVLIGFLAQYVPWILVPRSTFIYHYFASVPFIILCTVFFFDHLRKKRPAAFKWGAIGFCAAALILFIAFYPLMSGMPVAREYANYLRWFNWVNF